MALLAFLLVAACACLSSSYAQQDTSVWVPFTAQKVSREYALSTSGQDLISETRGFTARNKDGSLFIYDAANYDPSSREHHFGILQDAASGKTFRIDYDHQRVTVLQTPEPNTPLPLRPPTGEEWKPASPELSLGSKMIGGVRCIGWKVVAGGPHNPGGEIWVAPSLNYEVVESTVLDETHHMLMKMHLEDIQVGREPDHPELFRIPEGYQTLDVDRMGRPRCHLSQSRDKSVRSG
jgi:hypothetical protein